MTVPCMYPLAENYPGRREPPEGYDEWRTADFCTHVHCAEAADARSLLPAHEREEQARADLAEEGIHTDEDIQWRLK